MEQVAKVEESKVDQKQKLMKKPQWRPISKSIWQKTKK